MPLWLSHLSLMVNHLVIIIEFEVPIYRVRFGSGTKVVKHKQVIPLDVELQAAVSSLGHVGSSDGRKFQPSHNGFGSKFSLKAVQMKSIRTYKILACYS